MAKAHFRDSLGGASCTLNRLARYLCNRTFQKWNLPEVEASRTFRFQQGNGQPLWNPCVFVVTNQLCVETPGKSEISHVKALHVKAHSSTKSFSALWTSTVVKTPGEGQPPKKRLHRRNEPVLSSSHTAANSRFP